MPPKKGKKVNLSDFLADSSTGGGSWADEMDDLPTGPSGNPSDGSALGGSHLSRGQGGGGYGARDGAEGGFGSDRVMRPEVPFPTQAPYTAFVGNLTFETVEADLTDFFAGLEVTSIRLVSGQDGKPKGFGYVEFASADALRNALSATGTDLNGRPTRISVAEAPSQQMGRADAESTWTRKGPLESLPGRSGGFGSGAPRTAGGFGGDRAGGFGGGEEVEREGPIRGGKFQPSAPAPSRAGGGFGGGGGGFDRSSPGPGGMGGERREFQPAREQAEVEREGPIRGGKFQPSAPAPDRAERGFGSGFGGERRASGPGAGGEPSRADEGSWTRSGPLPPAAGGARGGFGDRTPPAERRPLQLSARSTSSSGASSPSASGAASPSAKPSPFGAAKPVDNAQREREIEAKLAKEREEARVKAQAAKDKRDREKSEAAAVGGEKEGKGETAWRKAAPAPAPTPAVAGSGKKTAPASASASTGTEDKPANATAGAAGDGDDSWTTVAKGAAVTVKDTVADSAHKATKLVQDKFAALSTDEAGDGKDE